jgi:rRNA-processing protein FCF1
MPGMRDQFESFYSPDKQAVATAMETGLVVPDTNVLLAAYRFQATARDELLSLFEKVGDRLWIPHQVGLEFHRNRLGVIAGQEAYFAKAQKELADSIATLRSRVRAFRTRIALGDEDVREIEDTIGHLRTLIEAQVTKAEEANEVHLDDHASDAVLAIIDTLFENRVGEPMEPAELEEARKEGERRVKEKIPPGYKDKDKDDPSGDYLVWRQLLTETAKQKPPAVVFITDDSSSDDWYQEVNGRTLGARRELREEMTREAGVPLLMMTTQSFLVQGGKHLKVHVSPETVDQAKELPNVVYVSASQTAQRLRLVTEGPSLHEALLVDIRNGKMVSPLELNLAMPALEFEVGDEMVPMMVAAVNDGMKAGHLTRDEGRRILDAVAQFVNYPEGQPSDEAPDG